MTACSSAKAAPTVPHDWADWVQSLEAQVNDVVFVGVAVYFLILDRVAPGRAS